MTSTPALTMPSAAAEVQTQPSTTEPDATIPTTTETPEGTTLPLTKEHDVNSGPSASTATTSTSHLRTNSTTTGLVPSASSTTHPPIVRSLHAIYPPSIGTASHTAATGSSQTVSATDRYSGLLSNFATFYHSQPDFLVRAPGRVNLIGEHIDYNGFGVLPVALMMKDVVIAAKICRNATALAGMGVEVGEMIEEEVEIMNVQQDQYQDMVYSVTDPTIPPSTFRPTASPRSAPPRASIRQTHPSLFTIPPASSLNVSDRGSGWTRYIQAGIKGVWEQEKERLTKYYTKNLVAASNSSKTKNEEKDMSVEGDRYFGVTDPFRYLQFPGMQLLVDGTIPPAAGLSSSSALVCASALLAAYTLRRVSSALEISRPAFSLEVPYEDAYSKLELAALCAQAEQYVGTAGGGMDQAIAFLSQKGSAMKINFQPTLAATPVTLPKNALFLVAHSGSRSEKVKTATQQFNKRVVECTLAAHVLAKSLKLCCYTPDYWYRKHEERRKLNTRSGGGRSSITSAVPASNDIPKLTLFDVLEASGKSLVEMIAFLQQAKKAAQPQPPTDDPSGDSNGDETDSPTSPSATSASTTAVPLHTQPYTLPELLQFFSTNSLKPLFHFQPTLIPSLLEDDYFTYLKQQVRHERRTKKATAGGADVKVPKTRVAFGRTIPVSRADQSPDDPTTFQILSTSTTTKDQPFPWEQPNSTGGSFTNNSFPLARSSAMAPTFLTESAASSATNAALTLTNGGDSTTGVTQPYRTQGDPSFSSPDHVMLRASYQKHPLIVKEINRFWMLLPKTSTRASESNLGRDDYYTFFMRLCKLFNPDLTFDESWKLIQLDWEKDVQRTREWMASAGAVTQKDGTATTTSSPSATNTNTKSGSMTKLAKQREAAAREREQKHQQIEITSIPYHVFFTSLYELIDIWSPDSSVQAYANLLDQVFNKLTVRVESRGGSTAYPPPSNSGVTTASSGYNTRTSDDSSATEAELADQHIPTFALYDRAMHVFTEALRVEQFNELCQRLSTATSTMDSTKPSASTSSSAELSSATVESLGELMNASHVSCARAYDCSTEDLDVLVNICVQKAGAKGARLTGAGWGGCVVAIFDTNHFVKKPLPSSTDSTTAAPSLQSSSSDSLLTGPAKQSMIYRESVQRILDTIINEYYLGHLCLDRESHSTNFNDLLFVTEPGTGAAIYIP